MIKKLTLIFIALLVIIALALFGFEQYAKRKSLKFLSVLGLNVYAVQDYTPSAEALQFQTITFDSENLNTLAQYKTSLTPANKLTAFIENVSLTGEIKNGALSLAHMDRQTPFRIAQFPLAQAVFKDIEISILTDTMSGLSVYTNGRIDRSAIDKDTLTLQLNSQSAQRNLKFDLAMNGTLQSNRWDISGNLNDGRIFYDPYELQLTRMQGTISARQKIGEPVLYFAQMNAGGLRLFDTAWQNVSLTLERRDELHRAFITGNSLYDEHIELSLTKVDNAVSASIFSPDGRSLAGFLSNHNKSNLVGNLAYLRGVDEGVEMKIETKGQDIGVDVINNMTQDVISSVTVSY